MPPTLELSPLEAPDYSLIRDKDKAVAASPYLPQARKGFLVQRWPYWDNWAKAGVVGLKSNGDRE